MKTAIFRLRNGEGEMVIQISDVTVRRATVDDAAEIANVHLNSWRGAYRNLLPQDFLDQLPLTFKRRMNMWKQTAIENKKPLFVAEAINGIVGFSVFEPARDASMNGYGEVGAIYLLEKFKGKKIGAALLKLGMSELIKMDYTKAYCWVLEGNPTIKFYESSGAVFNEMESPDEIGGKKVKELVYEWKDLSIFKNV